MRQIVSLVKDNQAHFAYVDDESGQIVQFADLLIPDTDRFGMIEAAGLGTSLVDFLGLNGAKRPLSPDMTVGSGIAARRRAAELEAADDRIALDHVAPTHVQVPDTPATVAPKRRGRPPGPNAKPKAIDQTVQRYIPLSEVVAVINGFPEGCTAKQIAQVISKEETPPHWVKRTVENRLATAEATTRTSGVALPFRIERIPKPGTKLAQRVVFPL